MSLISHRMALSAAEKRWLPWLGPSGKLAMGLACAYNRDRYPALESIFDNFGRLRVLILQQWAEQQWRQLEGLAMRLGSMAPEQLASELASRLSELPDVTELFILLPDNRVLASSAGSRACTQDHMRRRWHRACSKPFSMVPTATRKPCSWARAAPAFTMPSPCCSCVPCA
ncbi:hypothetical protein [Aquitalea magnusonii]|uniref:hypothetical protein n=1 Tax=Aquitalea magnusonii TaxID=332411 RepID=UPI00128EF507|nr:hypothetical protein [Aquitalea magnusonii]